MRPARPAALVLLAMTALIASACSSGASPTSEVKLSDALKIEPADITVKAGVPVTFVVTNTGAIDHEFFVGDENAQAGHDKEMAGQMAMTMDEPMGIGIKPGQTKELTVTINDAGTIFGGCHIPGHYAAGMKTTITVQ